MFPLILSYTDMTWMIWSAQFVSWKLDIMVHLDLRLRIIIIQEICCPHHMAFLTSGTLFGSSPLIEIHFIMLIPPPFMGRVYIPDINLVSIQHSLWSIQMPNKYIMSLIFLHI